MDTFNTVLQIFSNLCIVFITIYSAVLQFWHKSVRFLGYKHTIKMTGGNFLTLHLHNVSLSPISIEQIYLILENKTKVLINEYEVPLLVEGRRSFQVLMEPISNNIFDFTLLQNENKIVFIKLTEGNSIGVFSKTGWKGRLKFWLKNYRFLRNLKKNPRIELNNIESLGVLRIKYGDIILSENVEFILIVKTDRFNRTIFINESGIMSEECLIGGQLINGITPGSYEDVHEQLTLAFKEQQIQFELYYAKDVCEVNISNFFGGTLKGKSLEKWLGNRV